MRFGLRSFAILALLALSVRADDRPRRIAITFDDLPFADVTPSGAAEIEDVNRRILQALQKHHAVAIGFVNGNRVDTKDHDKIVATLELWPQGGQKLGNHSYSHRDFNELTLKEFIADAERNEPVLKQVLEPHGLRSEYFRYPFNHAGNEQSKKTGFENWLREHHYKVATCTVETSDYLFNRAYVRAIAAGDPQTAARIRSTYLDFTDAKLRYFEGVSVEIARREFPQVFLAHANRLNADVLDEMLTRMEKSGYRFVDIDEAQSDPIYRTQDNYVDKFGPMWAYRWAPILGKKIDGRLEPEPPQWILDAAAKLKQ